MKQPLIIIFCVALSIGVEAQGNPYQIKFVSSKCFSGYMKNEKHSIVYNPGLSENSCDTLYIDNQKYFVLNTGYTGEEISKGKYNWSTDIHRVLDAKSGRQLGPNTIDYDFRCYIFVGTDSQNKKANKVFLENHGSSVTYYK